MNTLKHYFLKLEVQSYLNYVSYKTLSAVQQYAGETGEYVITNGDVKLAKEQEAVINERMDKLDSVLSKYVALEGTITETVASKGILLVMLLIYQISPYIQVGHLKVRYYGML